MPSHATAFKLRHAANDEDLAPMLHRTMLSLVRKEGADLTARQLGVFLTVYLEERPHTVRGLATLFNICKPAVTRALDKLGEMGLATRNADPDDRRSVLVQRTDAGWRFLDELRSAMAEAAEEVGRAAAPPVRVRAWPRAVAMHRTGFGQSFAANVWPD